MRIRSGKLWCTPRLFANSVKNSTSARSTSKPAPRRLKGWKRWAFPLAAMVLVPGLFFVLLEVGLNIAKYGFPTDFLIQRRVADETVYTDNRQYGWRFFPQQVARRPADIALPAKKAPETFRVFVLGESAAMGDPDTAYGIPRMLDVMLSERFPGVRFEVVNAAMTGISSHIIQDIAKHCAEFQPDCFVIYMGNNEAIGPYGPGTVFASFSRSLALTRLSIAARSLKTSQLMDSLIRMRSKTDEPAGWGGLRVFMKSQFHPSDERMTLLAEHFESNLRDICQSGRNAGAKVVVCNVAVNLADCSPFASLNDPSLSPDQKGTWEAHWQKAANFEAQGKKEDALAAYTEAEKIDPSFADLHYRKGMLLIGLNRTRDAHESFVRARDCDALKFRTSSELNSRARKLAESFPSSDAMFVDAVKALEDDSAGKGVGANYFVDHVHLTFHGNYVVAREIAKAVSGFVPSGNNNATILTEQQCAERLAFTRWNQSRIAQHMLKRFQIPPFDTKSDNATRVKELKATIVRLQDAESTAGVQEAIAMFEKALLRKKFDADFLRSLADLNAELENHAEEIKCRKALYERFPYDMDRKAFLAEIYARSGNHADGEMIAREVLAVDPTHVIARLALATALDKRGAVDAAIAEYKEVLRWRPDLAGVRQRLDSILNGANTPALPVPAFAGSTASNPDEAQKLYEIGDKLLQENRVEEGIRQLRTAVKLDPKLVEAQMALAGALIHVGRVDEAVAQSKEALRLRPDYGQLHCNLGALLTDLGRFEEARTHLQEALRLDPNFEDAQLNLGLNLMKDKQPLAALRHLEAFSTKHPEDAELHLQIGMLHENTGNWKKAAESYNRALGLQPENEQYQSCLAWILATSPLDDVRNGKEAVRLAEAACRKQGQAAYFLDTLAAAQAEDGLYSEAVKTAQQALSLARAANDPETDNINKRLSLYMENKPYRLQVAASSNPETAVP
jgi:tetratricopeptide (TPR) repeat protein